MREHPSPGNTTPGQLSRTLFRGPRLHVGLFDCPRQHPRFNDTGPANGHLIVFPLEQVEIVPAGAEPVVATANVITLYNRGQEYQRRAISEYGDRAMYIGFNHEYLLECMIDAGHHHGNMEQSAFISHHATCSNQNYLLSRQLLFLLQNPESSDALEVEDLACQLLADTLCHTQGAPAAPAPGQHQQRAATRRRHRTLMRECQALLARQLTEPLSLPGIAAELATTPFHLSRVFSQYAGEPLHRSLMKLRLRHAADRMLQNPRARLTDISVDSGFATPSHFTQRFRQNFGSTPAAFRRHLLREPSLRKQS